MLRVAVNRVVPLPEACDRIGEIVDGAVGDAVWVIAKDGKPRAAVVDVQYLDELIRRAWFDALADRTQAAFRQYLLSRGLDPDQLTEEDVDAIIQEPHEP